MVPAKPLPGDNNPMRTSGLDIYIAQYASFERLIGEKITTVCKPFCTNCNRICCKPDFCQESVESPFLSLIHSIYSPGVSYSPQKGWLTDTGCALSVGRPPVCYEFYCNEIIQANFESHYHDAIKILFNLVSHLGKNALGQQHIVEIMDMEKLYQLNFSRLSKQFFEAKKIFEEMGRYFNF